MDKIGQFYNITITVTDESLNMVTTELSVTVVVGVDTDGDGLSDGREITIGTDPNDYDSDGDLLGDGFENQYNLDPLDDDQDGNGTRDDQDDFDDDGLSNLDEQVFDTDPESDDSDGDGTGDQDETDQGSNPNDPTDGGMAPDDDDIVELTLTVGDFSGSNSERYDLIVGDIRHQATQFGIVETRTYKFRRGESYEIQIVHRGSKFATPDLDYSADISIAAGETDSFFIEDPDDILRIGWFANGNPVFYPDGKSATLYLPDGNLTVSHEGTGEVSENIEDTTGGLVALKGERGTVMTAPLFDRPETVPTTLTFSNALDNTQNPLSDLPGNFILEFPTSIRLFKVRGEQNALSNEVVSGVTEFDAGIGTSVFAIGTSASTALGDVEVQLKWKAPDTGQAFEFDSVKLSVVIAEFAINYTTFIPLDFVADPTNPIWPGPDLLFEGDDRGFDRNASTFRTRQLVYAYARPEFATVRTFGPFTNQVGETISYDVATSIDPNDPTRLSAAAKAEPKNPSNLGAPFKIAWKTASGDTLNISVTATSTNVTEISINGNEKNPLVPLAPGITWNYDIIIDASNPINPTYQLVGLHDAFPAHELYINQQQIYTHDPIAGGNGLIDLFDEPIGEDISVDKSDNIVPPANPIVALVSPASSLVDSSTFIFEIGVEWARMERNNNREQLSGSGVPAMWDQNGKAQGPANHAVIEEPFSNNPITNDSIQKFAPETNLQSRQTSSLTDPFDSEADLVFELLGKEDILGNDFRRGIL